jgi:hypothetical protein
MRRKYLMSLTILMTPKTPTILKTRTSRSRFEIHFHLLLSEETTNVYLPHSDEIVRAYAPRVNTEKGAKTDIGDESDITTQLANKANKNKNFTPFMMI